MSQAEEAVGRDFLKTLIEELRKLKAQGDKAIAQVTDERKLHLKLDEESNSIDILVRHLAENMLSRWTDFLTSDGEKPTRNRDAEFEPAATLTRAQLLEAWEKGWACLFHAMESLTPANLRDRVKIRGQELPALDAVMRAFSHYAGHVGQIVFLAKHLEWQRWQTLSVPRKKPAAS